MNFAPEIYLPRKKSEERPHLRAFNVMVANGSHAPFERKDLELLCQLARTVEKRFEEQLFAATVIPELIPSIEQAISNLKSVLGEVAMAVEQCDIDPLSEMIQVNA